MPKSAGSNPLPQVQRGLEQQPQQPLETPLPPWLVVGSEAVAEVAVTDGNLVMYDGTEGTSVADSGIASADVAALLAAPPGSVSATTVEVDLGSTPVFAGSFTITDAAITSTSKVLCWQAPGPYTDKGAGTDAAAMETVQVIAVEPGTGSALVRWQTPPIVTIRPFGAQGKRNTMGLSSVLVPGNALRVNRVWKKIKFSYMVLS